MKKVISIAHFFCLAILFFGFAYYILLTVFYFSHITVATPLESMKEDVKIWMERAFMFILGSSAGSKAKDDNQADTTGKMIQALQSSTPVVSIPPIPEPVAAPAQPANP